MTATDKATKNTLELLRADLCVRVAIRVVAERHEADVLQLYESMRGDATEARESEADIRARIAELAGADCGSGCTCTIGPRRAAP